MKSANAGQRYKSSIIFVIDFFALERMNGLEAISYVLKASFYSIFKFLMLDSGEAAIASNWRRPE